MWDAPSCVMAVDFGTKKTGSIRSITSAKKGGKAKPKAEVKQANDLSKLPPTPLDMGQVATAHWHYVGAQLEDLGVIMQIDLSVFRRYCECYETYVQAMKDVREHGTTQITESGYSAPSSYETVRKNAAAELDKLETQLGLTPMARKKLNLSHEPDKDEGLGID